MSNTDQTQSISKQGRVQGIIKWFNKKQGYGFIHVLSGEHTEKDIFVHYSNIRSKEPSVYKYLVQGEYVEFVIEKANKENHEYIAVDITGLYENATLCETRRLMAFQGEEEAEAPVHHRRRHSEDRRPVDDRERERGARRYYEDRERDRNQDKSTSARERPQHKEREEEEGFRRVIRGKNAPPRRVPATTTL